MQAVQLLKYGVFFLIAFFAGILFQKYIGVWQVKEKIFGLPSYIQKRNEVQIEEVDKSKLMVALAFGQSNSANFGNQLNSSDSGVYNFYQGRLYEAKDHMLGADGRGGSVWPILGDLLIKNNHFSAVIFATIGVSGSGISRWAPRGDLHQKLLETIKSLQKNGYTITHLLWHQGETDASLDTKQEHYVRHFMAMKNAIRSMGVSAPFYVSIASRYRDEAADDKIRNAQKEIIVNFSDVFPGPDTDQLANEYRYDGTHFSAKGMTRAAQLWFQAIEKK